MPALSVPQAAEGPQTSDVSNLLVAMKAARIWLLWKAIPEPGKSKPRKVPFYVTGEPRRALDSPEDRTQLVTYEEAVTAFTQEGSQYAGLAIALGPDGHGGYWQGIDLDDVETKGLSDIVNRWVRGDCGGWGYIEVSPSGSGVHILGYGQHFASLASNKSGIEAYAGGRFFTFTGVMALSNSPCRSIDLADYVQRELLPRHDTGRMALTVSDGVELVSVDPKTVTVLRAALFHMRSDDRQLWIRMGMALRELGDPGRGLWLNWSATSDKFDPKVAARTWDGFKPANTGYPAVFAEAARQGWVNPESAVAQLVAPTVLAGGFQARTPRNFLSTACAPALDLANLPRPIAEFASAYSGAHGFDRSGVIMAAIAATAAMISDDYVLEVKPGWRVSARLWTVLIGKSATGKSPTIKTVTAPIKEKHTALIKDFWATYVKPDADDPNPEPPPVPALYTSDSTVEALSEKLRNNPRGMLMLTEEFSSWIGSIDSSGRGEAAKSRGAWLQLYDGGPYQIDRIMRGSFEVPNWGASVLTATTPTALAEHMKHLPEDGLIQRFIPVILGYRNPDADGDALEAQERWRQALLWVYDQAHSGVVQFSPEARILFKHTEKVLGQAAMAMDDVSPALASHIGKNSEMIARIALVFHVLEAKPGVTILSVDTLRKAVNLMAQLRKHSVALFTDILGRSPSTEIARALAHSLVAADSALQSVGRDWMTQHCRAFAQAKDDRVRREAIQLLEDLDWLQVTGARTYGGWPTKWEVNGMIFQLYAREGEAHRARRAAVQAMIGDQSEGHAE